MSISPPPQLFYKEMGQGQPLVILHGLLGSLNNWQTVAKDLSASFHVILPDQRNHGRSFHSPSHSYKLLAEDLLRLLDNLQLNNIRLVGHSMGGKAAMTFAILFPDRISHLVVVDIAPRVYSSAQDGILDALTRMTPEAISSRSEADHRLAEWIPEQRVRQFLLTNLKKRNGSGYEWRMNLQGLKSNLRELTKGIEAPAPATVKALFIRGERSSYVDRSDISHIRRIFSRAIIQTIPGAGHWVHADAPEEFTHAVREFLL